MGAVDLEDHQIVFAHAGAPGAVDLRDDAARELEDRIGGVVGIGDVAAGLLVDPLRDVVGAQAEHAPDVAEQVVEHVAPVAEHVQDDATAVRLPVVPGRALRGLPVALEHPVAEVALDREDAPEEAGVRQHLELLQPRQPELVLDHAVPDAGRLGGAPDRKRVVEALGAGFSQ